MGKMGMKKMSAMKSKSMGAMKMMSMKGMGMKKMMSMKKMMAMKMAKVVGRKSSVFKGSRVKTSGGLKASDLKLNKDGKVVSKKQSQGAKMRYHAGSKASKWATALKKARAKLGIQGFVPIGGKTKEGQVLLAKTRSLYKKK